MEPVIIIVKEMVKGKITLTEEELKAIIRQTYNEGYWEGRKNSWLNYPITYTSTTGNPTIDYNTHTNTPPADPNIIITCTNTTNNIPCEAHNAIGD